MNEQKEERNWKPSQSDLQDAKLSAVILIPTTWHYMTRKEYHWLPCARMNKLTEPALSYIHMIHAYTERLWTVSVDRSARHVNKSLYPSCLLSHWEKTEYPWTKQKNLCLSSWSPRMFLFILTQLFNTQLKKNIKQVY